MSAPGTAAATAAAGLNIKAAEDEPSAWGDMADKGGDRDLWLKEQRPPHWG